MNTPNVQYLTTFYTSEFILPSYGTRECKISVGLMLCNKSSRSLRAVS